MSKQHKTTTRATLPVCGCGWIFVATHALGKRHVCDTFCTSNLCLCTVSELVCLPARLGVSITHPKMGAGFSVLDMSKFVRPSWLCSRNLSLSGSSFLVPAFIFRFIWLLIVPSERAEPRRRSAVVRSAVWFIPVPVQTYKVAVMSAWILKGVYNLRED